MADVKWIKITTDIFDDEKILLIESLPDAYAIIVVWFKLLCLAGKMNNSGVFVMNNSIAYTDKMLSTIFRMKESTVQLALRTFQDFGMIDVVDNVITIPNWGKHQSLEAFENRKQYMREYMQEYRERQKAISCKPNSKVNSKTNVNSLEEDIEVDKEEEIDKEISIVSKDTIRQTESVRQVVDAWNQLSSYGIATISRIGASSKRYKSLVARLNEYGLDDVLSAIGNIKDSPFLQGKNNTEWTISFDWFVKPGNFPKVLEGNYLDKSKRVADIPNEAVEDEEPALDFWSDIDGS